MQSIVIADAGIISLAALPILEHLKQSGVRVDTYYGTGGGALLLAMHLLEFTQEQIVKVFGKLFSKDLNFKVNFGSLMKLAGFNPFGSSVEKASLCGGDDLLKQYRDLFGTTKLEDLPAELYVGVTKVPDGTGKFFQKGALPDILYASNTLYPLTAPIEIEGEMFGSGVYYSYFPILQAVDNLRDNVLGIDFSNGEMGECESYFEYWMNLFHKSYVVKEREMISQRADNIPIYKIELEQGFSLWNVANIPDILKVGQKFVESRK